MRRLVVYVTEPQRADLLDVPVPPVKGRVEFRRLDTEEVWTPAGFPLCFYVNLGPHGGGDELICYSAGTEMLRVSGGLLEGAVGLLLSTEERLYIAVIETR